MSFTPLRPVKATDSLGGNAEQIHDLSQNR